MRPCFPLIPLFIAVHVVACASTDNVSTTTANTDSADTSLNSGESAEQRPANSGAALEDVTGGTERAVAIPASAGTSSSTQDSIQDGAQEINLRRQKAVHLANGLVAQGIAQLERAELDAALQSFADALDLDTTNQPARANMRRVQSLMGDRYQTAATLLQDEHEREIVRRAQALLEAELFSDRGDQALVNADYDGALEQYRQAQIILGYHPYIATGSLDEQVIANKIASTVVLRDNAVAETHRVAQAEADDARQAAEQAERDRIANKLGQFYRNANSSFLNENYKEAEQWCQMILIEDPGNAKAIELANYATEARHYQTDELNRRHYREQWLRTMEDLETADLPQVEALVFNDLKRWKEVIQRKPLQRAMIDNASTVERAAVIERLNQITLAPNFGGPDGEGSPLEEVAAYLQRLTLINFWISTKVRDELDEEDTAVQLQMNSRSVRKVLDLIAELTDGLNWKVEDGVVKFVTDEEMTGGQMSASYSVHDLILPIPDYPGRDININPSGGLTPPDEDIEEREANVVSSTLLEDLIRSSISPESWDEDPSNSIRITDTGTMVVNHVPEVHEMIKNLLEDLREATSIMVDIQANFMKVEDNFLEDIGVDFRGLGQPGPGSSGNNFNDMGDATIQAELGSGIGQGSDVGAFLSDGEDGDMRARVEELYDTALGDPDVMQGNGGLSFQWAYLGDLELELILRAVSKSERSELVTAPRILVHNTARANLSVLNQIAYVQDFDVEIAQAASIADPIIAVIQDGVILDVRPVVSADRRFITLELRPTVAELKRPISERQTTLGSQSSVTIQLPEVEIQRVRTSVPMPDGGTVMLGGNKISEKRNNQSGIPILNKIPFLSALFERKGTYVSNRKLLILLTADIVIPEEVEPTWAELGLAEAY